MSKKILTALFIAGIPLIGLCIYKIFEPLNEINAIYKEYADP